MSLHSTVGTPFVELGQVESTNNYATGAIHAGMAQHGMAVFAHHQTKGKGQRNRQWQGEAGKNIALSVVLQPPGLAISQSFLLSMATAVGVYHFFSHYTGSECSVKWPNDLYWRDRKAGGILIENIIQGQEWKAAVIGIGLNMNQTSFEELNTRAVSLRQITGLQYQPVLLAIELCRYLSEAFSLLHHQPSELVEQYRRRLYKRYETVRLKHGSRVFEAVVKDVTVLGELVVEHGTEERFGVGEVEWITR